MKREAGLTYPFIFAKANESETYSQHPSMDSESYCFSLILELWAISFWQSGCHEECERTRAERVPRCVVLHHCSVDKSGLVTCKGKIVCVR